MTANTTNQPSRRDILKWFAGIPFLPLGAMGTAAALTGCNDDDDNNSIITKPLAQFKNAKFTPMSAPATAEDMATTTCSSKLSIDWDDGTSTDYQLGYKPFFRTGDEVPDGHGGTIIAGGYFDINNQPIIDRSVAGKERQFFSDSPDGSSLLTVEGADAAKLGVKGNPVFHVVQFEYNTRDQAGHSTYGALPSPIAVLTLDQDPKTGHLELVKYHNVDTSAAHGLWITCGASLSPWGTHLSSEEYEPDAWDQGLGGQALEVFEAYSQNVFGDKTSANPYNYGHLPEVTVLPDGTAKIEKHFCLGRISHELVQVFPDNRTVLMGDDATNGGLFMFVADQEKDLSAGTLYVAKFVTPLTDTTIGQISWIKLGHATSQEIDDLINKDNIKKEDILDSIADTTLADDAARQQLIDQGYKKITLQKKVAWVKIKNEKAAAFLETHRYAAYMGASMALTKNEGTTVNATDKKAYSALANIVDSMVEGGNGYVAAHNVKFPKITAGGVLEHDLQSGLVDSENNAIDSEWVPASSRLLIHGTDIDMDNLGNTADVAQIASPDNLKYSETLRTLFIGEDSGNHINNFLWAYNVDTGALDRLLATPAGAESTGLHAVDSINGWTYIMSNFQHPGDEWDRYYQEDDAGNRTGGLPEALQTEIDTLINHNYNDKFSGAVGYITADPIAPSIEKKVEDKK